MKKNIQSALAYTKACPSRTELEQYYLGELSPDQEAAVAAHLRRHCPACQAVVALLMQDFVDLSPTVPLPPLAEESKQMAENFAGFWAKLQDAAAALPAASDAVTAPPVTFAELLQRVKEGVTVFFAELTAGPALAPALRGEADQLPLVYRLAEIEIRVDLQPELGTDRKVLVGQVKAPPAALTALQVDLQQAGQTIAVTPVESKRGRFQLPSLPPGDYTLVVRSNQWEIRLPNLACR